MSKKWLSVNCSRCFSFIGEGLYQKSKEEEKEELVLSAVRFNKYMTLIELENGADEKE